MKLKTVTVWGSIAICASWLLSAVIILYVFPNNEAHGTFGDLFGAINALFSGLAFLGVIVAILLQKEELEEQRKEIKQSRIAQDLSAKALGQQSRIAGLMARLDATNHLLASIVRQIERIEKSGRYDASTTAKALSEKQEKYEIVIEKILTEIEALEEANHERPK